MKKLPVKLSEWHAASLRDLRKVEKMKRYKVDMNTWHEPKNKICYVCQAGAVMACTLKMDHREFASCYNARTPINRVLLAVNWLRTGNVAAACESFGIQLPTNLNKTYPAAAYTGKHTHFYRDQWRINKLLVAAGL